MCNFFADIAPKDHFCTFASIKPLVNCLAPPSVRYSYSLCSLALTACHQLLSIFGAPPIFSLCFYVTIVGGQSGTSLVARGTGTTEGRMAPGRGHHGTTAPGHTGSREGPAPRPTGTLCEAPPGAGYISILPKAVLVSSGFLHQKAIERK